MKEAHAALLLAASAAADDAKVKKLSKEGGKSLNKLLDSLVPRLQVR